MTGSYRIHTGFPFNPDRTQKSDRNLQRLVQNQQMLFIYNFIIYYIFSHVQKCFFSDCIFLYTKLHDTKITGFFSFAQRRCPVILESEIPFYKPTTCFAWPGGVCEGRAAFATVSALPSQVFHISKYEKVLGFILCYEKVLGFILCYEQVLGFILKYQQVYRTGPVKI